MAPESGSLAQYMESMKSYPLLTVDEEQELGRRNRGGDAKAAEKLVTSNLRFVVKVAHEYRGYGLPLIDLVQEGNLGLIRAVKKFDPDRKFRLVSYAVWWIRAYMQNYIMKNWSLVKMGTTQDQRKLFFKLESVRRELAKVFGDEAADDPVLVGKLTQTKPEEVESMRQRLKRDISLDAPVYRDSGESAKFIDLLPAGTLIDEGLIKQEMVAVDAKKVSRALGRLMPRERYIIEQHKMSDEPMTLDELGRKFGLSRERIRQIERRALEKLKEFMGHG